MGQLLARLRGPLGPRWPPTTWCIAEDRLRLATLLGGGAGEGANGQDAAPNADDTAGPQRLVTLVDGLLACGAPEELAAAAAAGRPAWILLHMPLDDTGCGEAGLERRRGSALDAEWAAADLGLLFSRAETFGLVVTESIARGVPVVVRAGTGAVEALAAGTPAGADDAAALPGTAVALGADRLPSPRCCGAGCPTPASAPGGKPQRLLPGTVCPAGTPRP